MSSAAVEPGVRARIGAWPYERDVAHLVLLDHHMVPDVDAVSVWVEEARRNRWRAIRTGALFPPSVPAFTANGFSTVDTLSLFEARADDVGAIAPGGVRTRRLRRPMLEEAALVDRRAFTPPWGNDAAALANIVSATPHHRARCVRRDGRMVGFVISGRAASVGYIQRLAVDPSVQRRGIGRSLVDDAVRWMQRRGVGRVLVNTAVDNGAASSLYRSCGFEELPDRLRILERELGDA